MSINFYNEEIDFSILNEEKISYWINNIISEYKHKTGEISFIFCSDDYLLQINQKFLKHDYFTDIITFNDNVDLIINGDVYISIDRVKENSLQFSSTFSEELKRVIIHGILHLLGFSDNTEELKKEMRKLEDQALAKVKDLIIN